jgi:hypothetical protein
MCQVMMAKKSDVVRSRGESHLPIEYRRLLMNLIVDFPAMRELIPLIEEYWTDWFLLWSYGLTDTGLFGQRTTRAHVRDVFRWETSGTLSSFVYAADAILTFLAASHPERLTGEQLQEALWVASNGIKHDMILFPTFGIRQRECSTHQWTKLYMTFECAANHLESFLSELIDLQCLDVDQSSTSSLGMVVDHNHFCPGFDFFFFG